jgi:hypothetical protein
MVITMSRKDTTKTITYRENSQVADLFDELLECDDRDKSEIYREIVREWMMERGLDDGSAEAIISDIEQEIRDIDNQIDELKRKKQELQDKKDKVESLAGSVDLDSSGSNSAESGASRRKKPTFEKVEGGGNA